LGEAEEEVFKAFRDLRDAGCDFLSMGQYLRPTKSHYPVKEYITPEKFDYYRKRALELGFLHVLSGPYVRSSYCAGEYLEF
ncbi:MAG: lipoyl synthase, partial [Candidatus Omnitrophica bacterium]|nr:lipoyl synthase [Candidatus Omnitrophota bacterium]